MSEAWETYYLMVGSSAAALIGLLFVVITLSGEIEPARAEGAQATFMTPTVFHFVIVFAISAAAVAPELAPPLMGAATVIPAAIGLFFSVGALARLSTGRIAAPHWTDYLFYGALPAGCYFWILGSGIGIAFDMAWADGSVAIGVLALLLLGIRDAWDLATWLTYHKNG